MEVNMEKIAVRMIVPAGLTDELESLAKEHNIACSAPQPADSNVEPLNAPITGSEVIIVAQVITALISAAGAGVVFFSKLTELLSKKKEKIRVIVKNTGEDVIITGETDAETIKKIIGHV